MVEDHADTNEGFFTEGLKRLVFGAPKRRSAFVKVKTRDGEPDRALTVGQDYATLTLASQNLAANRFLFTRYNPVFFAKGSFPQDLDAPITYSSLVPLFGEELGANGRNLGGANTGDRPLFAQTPYRGSLDVQLTLLASQSAEILKTVMGISNDVRRALNTDWGENDLGAAPDLDEDDGLEMGVGMLDAENESVLGDMVGLARKVITPEKSLFAVGSAAARAFIAMDGKWTPRLEHAAPLPPLETGHYALLQVKTDAQALDNLEYDVEERRLYQGNKLVSGKDYAVVRVDATDRRQDISQIPELGEAFKALDLVFISGGDVKTAMETFSRTARVSPYLTESDKAELVDRVARRFNSFESHAAEGSTNETLLKNIVTSFPSLKKLQDVWNTATDVYDQVKVLTGAPGAATDATTEPSAPGPDPAPPPTPSFELEEPDRFEEAIKFTLRWEGGFSDIEEDRGGATNMGITEGVYHGWLASQGEEPRPVREITHAEVFSIYRSNYWLSARCPQFEPDMDLIQFDAAVNHGPGGAGRILQRALVEAGQPVTVDGAVGPKTLGAARRVPPLDLSVLCIKHRRALYHRIVENDPSQQIFINGWMNRINDLEAHLGLGTNESAAEITPEDTPFAGWVD